MFNWPSQVRPLTASQLPEALEGPRLVGIHCWASWNGHDAQFADQLRVTAARFSLWIDLYALDIEQPANVERLAGWEIRNVPALVIFRHGVRVATFWMRGESAAELRQRVDDWLAREAA